MAIVTVVTLVAVVPLVLFVLGKCQNYTLDERHYSAIIQYTNTKNGATEMAIFFTMSMAMRMRRKLRGTLPMFSVA
jgi:hypothetical protein